MKRTHVFFIPFPDILAINYTALKYCNLPRSGLRKNIISTHRKWHSRHTNYVATLQKVLIDRLKRLMYFLILLHYIKVFATSLLSCRKYKVSTPT
jgi:hypothetical protein